MTFESIFLFMIPITVMNYMNWSVRCSCGQLLELILSWSDHEIRVNYQDVSHLCRIQNCSLWESNIQSALGFCIKSTGRQWRGGFYPCVCWLLFLALWQVSHLLAKPYLHENVSVSKYLYSKTSRETLSDFDLLS